MCIKDRIIPIPQRFSRLSGPELILGVPGRANYRLETAEGDTPLLRAAEALLRRRLEALLGVCSRESGGEVTIRLALGAAPEGIANPDQGYRLTAADNTVTLTGFGGEGVYYAAVTLCQCLAMEDNRLALPAFEVLDWPDLRTRGHFMESRYGSNLMTLDDWKHVVDHMAAMKMNQLVVAVYGCWCVQYDGRVSEYLYLPIHKYPKLKTPVVTRYYSPAQNGWVENETLPPMVTEDFFGDLIEYGKEKNVSVFPLFNSYGHNTLIPAQYPEVSAKDKNGEPALTGFCTNTEKTYELLFAIYDEIIDRYLIPHGVDSFHIGLDEVWAGLAHNANDIFKTRSDFCLCEKCRASTKEKLYIDHAIRLLKHLKSRGMKHIYMYHDMLIKHPNKPGDTDNTEIMTKALRDNDLMNEVVIDWWTYSDFQESLMFQSTKPEQGLRRTVKPWNGYYHWNIVSHPLPNIYLLGKMAKEEGCEGMQSYSAWDESYDRNHVAQSLYAWNFDGSGCIQQASDAYVKARFGAQFDKARRGFALLDSIMAHSNEKRADGKPVISNYGIMMSQLSYYFYSYVRAGKPYPRNFPGEALNAMQPERAAYEKAISAIAAMAQEAEGLFEEVAADPACDQRMARRFAWETAHARCLAMDYLALFAMSDLAASCGEKVCGCAINKIRTMAGERKAARLHLMERLERVKEPFLMASHMRNQSIFMQLFADIEGYLAQTPADEVKLDFSDLGYLASPMFWKLR